MSICTLFIRICKRWLIVASHNNLCDCILHYFGINKKFYFTLIVKIVQNLFTMSCYRILHPLTTSKNSLLYCQINVKRRSQTSDLLSVHFCLYSLYYEATYDLNAVGTIDKRMLNLIYFIKTCHYVSFIFNCPNSWILLHQTCCWAF